MFIMQAKAELWNSGNMGSFRDYLVLYFYFMNKETQANRMQNGKAN